MPASASDRLIQRALPGHRMIRIHLLRWSPTRGFGYYEQIVCRSGKGRSAAGANGSNNGKSIQMIKNINIVAFFYEHERVAMDGPVMSKGRENELPVRFSARASAPTAFRQDAPLVHNPAAHDYKIIHRLVVGQSRRPALCRGEGPEAVPPCAIPPVGGDTR